MHELMIFACYPGYTLSIPLCQSSNSKKVAIVLLKSQLQNTTYKIINYEVQKYFEGQPFELALSTKGLFYFPGIL